MLTNAQGKYLDKTYIHRVSVYDPTAILETDPRLKKYIMLILTHNFNANI